MMCKDTKKYTINQFREEYPDENACLDRVFNLSFGRLPCCPSCKSPVKFRRIPTRRCYQCPKCYHQLYPCKNTIFEKSRTPLMYWFYAMFLFSVSKNGFSAMELMRQIGVTYKTAWRMLHQIRNLLKQDNTVLTGTIEADETFIGGKNKNRHKNKRVQNGQGRSFKDKTPVLGMLQREGIVAAYVIADTKSKSIQPVVLKKVAPGSSLMTDEWGAYKGLSKHYYHEQVFHNMGQYSYGDVTTNRIENFWSVVKRTINGSYIRVSPKYLQKYIDECVFRYNNRSNPQIFNEFIFRIAS